MLVEVLYSNLPRTVKRGRMIFPLTQNLVLQGPPPTDEYLEILEPEPFRFTGWPITKPGRHFQAMSIRVSYSSLPIRLVGVEILNLCESFAL